MMEQEKEMFESGESFDPQINVYSADNSLFAAQIDNGGAFQPNQSVKDPFQQ